jgi:beta-lactamase class A
MKPFLPRVIQAQLHELILSVQGDVALYYHNLHTNTSYTHNEQLTVNTASLMKVVVGLQLTQLIQQGKLSYAQTHLLHNSFISKADGSLYALSPTIDSDPELYTLLGTPVSLIELLRRMITRSSNLATNNLFQLIEPMANASQLLQHIGMHHTQILRGVEDQKAFDAGIINHTTAADMATLFTYIHQHLHTHNQAVSLLHHTLCEQEHNHIIPALLPSTITIAHKTGNLQRSLHDAALITTHTGIPYVLVILSQNLQNLSHAQTTFAQLSNILYHAT